MLSYNTCYYSLAANAKGDLTDCLPMYNENRLVAGRQRGLLHQGMASWARLRTDMVISDTRRE